MTLSQEYYNLIISTEELSLSEEAMAVSIRKVLNQRLADYDKRMKRKYEQKRLKEK